jgi:hypothetical protein
MSPVLVVVIYEVHVRNPAPDIGCQPDELTAWEAGIATIQ